MKPSFIIALATAPIAAFWLGALLSSANKNPETAAPEASPLKAPPSKSEPERERGLIETIDSLPSLSLSECNKMLDTWKQQTDALTDQTLLYDAIARAEAAILPTLAKDLLSQEGELASEARYVLALRWTSTDPLELARFHFDGKPAPFSLPVHIDQLCRNLVQQAPIPTLDWLLELSEKNRLPSAFAQRFLNTFQQLSPDTETLDAAQTRLVALVAAIPPNAALAQAPSPETPRQDLLDALASMDSTQLSEAVGKYAAIDLEATLSLLDAISDPRLQRSLRLQSLRFLADKDPAKTLVTLQSLYPNSYVNIAQDETGSFRNIAHALFEKNPDAIVAWFETNSDPAQAERLLAKIAPFANVNRLEQMEALMLLPKSTSRIQSLERAMRNLFQNDWEPALEWAYQNLSDKELDRALFQLAFSNKADMDIRIEVANTIKISHERSSAFQVIAQNFGSKDLNQALDWAKALPLQEDRNAALSSLSEQWFQSDPDGAYEYLQSVSDETLRSRLETAFANKIANSYPQQEIPSFLDKLESREARQSLAVGLIQKQSAVDPQAALASALSLSDSDPVMRESLMRVLAHNWSNTDPQSAAKVLWQVQDNSTQGTIYPLVSAIGRSDPEALIEIVDTLPNSDFKRKVAQAIRNEHTLQMNHPEIVEYSKVILGEI